jgi:hypothetical protein
MLPARVSLQRRGHTLNHPPHTSKRPPSSSAPQLLRRSHHPPPRLIRPAQPSPVPLSLLQDLGRPCRCSAASQYRGHFPIEAYRRVAEFRSPCYRGGAGELDCPGRGGRGGRRCVAAWFVAEGTREAIPFPHTQSRPRGRACVSGYHSRTLPGRPKPQLPDHHRGFSSSPLLQRVRRVGFSSH